MESDHLPSPDTRAPSRVAGTSLSGVKQAVGQNTDKVSVAAITNVPEVENGEVEGNTDLESQQQNRSKRNFWAFESKGQRLKTAIMTSKKTRMLNSFPLARLHSDTRESISTEPYLRMSQLVYDLSPDQVRRWPGILGYYEHMQHDQFAQLLEPQFNIIWRLIERENPRTLSDCWHWCFKVIEIFNNLCHDGKEPTIEAAYTSLVSGIKSKDGNLTATEQATVTRAIFAVLCWTSATVTPLLRSSSTGGPEAHNVHSRTVPLEARNSHRKYSTKDIRRPVGKLFQAFRSSRQHIYEENSTAHPTNMATPSSGNSDIPANSIDSDVLYESTLNFSSLQQIGRVRLELVDTITAHLAFDRSTRTLSIFRFPSLCVASIVSQRENGIISRYAMLESHGGSPTFCHCSLTDFASSTSITTNVLPPHCYTDSRSSPEAIHREILLTYRILFAQSPVARKLLIHFLQAELDVGNGSATDTTDKLAPTTPSPADNIDPVLLQCTVSARKSRVRRVMAFQHEDKEASFPSDLFPTYALNMDNHIQDCDTYSARDDFPVFGQRLLSLQAYNRRQQPSRVRDLWRDRRNPLQWYTFWAVLWVGGASIILAILQLVIAILQTAIAVEDLNSLKS